MADYILLCNPALAADTFASTRFRRAGRRKLSRRRGGESSQAGSKYPSRIPFRLLVKPSTAT
jgi:hypothetical protein